MQYDFPELISPHIRATIEASASSALKAQFVASAAEHVIHPAELDDPIADAKFSPVKGIVHRYPDRCLLTPIFTCPVYCRFCFRKETLGVNKALTTAELAICYQYIAANANIWEVILSGGDPLLLKPTRLQQIITELSAISHVEVIRIHSRIPLVCPEKITKAMLAVLQLHKPTYLVLHTNHADEFTPVAEQAIASIVDSGVPMLSQTVLLRGVNDNEQCLGKLMRKLVKNRVKPYYLHHPDLVKGTSHFRCSIDEGRRLTAALRGNYSGLCQPNYVLDIPGGHGKVPIGFNYIQPKKSIDTNVHAIANRNDNINCGIYEVTDYQGQVHEYQDRD